MDQPPTLSKWFSEVFLPLKNSWGISVLNAEGNFLKKICVTFLLISDVLNTDSVLMFLTPLVRYIYI